MALLFIEPHGSAEPWRQAGLDGHDAIALADDPDRPVRLLRSAPSGATRAVVLRQQTEAGQELWVLIPKGAVAVAVNGQAIPMAIRVLRHRDEVRVGTLRLFFSTERLAHVEPFPGAEQPVFCARSKLPIEKGTPAVRCPGLGCGAWHIQTDELPGWTYAATCALCDYPTDLNGDFRWTPDGL